MGSTGEAIDGVHISQGEHSMGACSGCHLLAEAPALATDAALIHQVALPRIKFGLVNFPAGIPLTQNALRTVG